VTPDVLAPLALVIAGLLAAPMTKQPRLAVCAVVAAAVLPYMWWRITATVPWTGGAAALALPLFVLAVELLSLFDAAVLFMTLARQSDRSGEADVHEARLRATAPADLPRVDVFIATYNEGLEVLEKTIVGCRALDWPNVDVWVLDDGRRHWLRDYCAAKGVGYITRPDNKGAKAGNINHALGVTTAPFVMVLDADFVPKREFLMRTMGFFEDPKIGIVQVPHAFFNHDPLQSNLSLRRELPDDQRFFFEAIMPGRDGWDGAFCCGSNSVTRRTLFEDIGGGLPEGSITEDMLLTLAGLRQGYITRYLNEPLAHGLAPESVAAFFVQRQRWAQGAMQILHLKEGPLGPGLKLVHRLLFLPTSWISQSLLAVASVTLPAVMLLTGVPAMVNVSGADVLRHVAPMMVAILGGIALLAPGRYYWPAAMVLSVFQSFRLLPVVLQTLVRPRGLIFKVTPKGNAAGTGRETFVFAAANVLIVANLVGMIVNAIPDLRVLAPGIPLAPVASWAAFNLLVLILVAMMCLQKPARRAEERFPLWDMAVVTPRGGGPSFTTVKGDISLSGLGVDTPDAGPGFAPGDEVMVRIAGVGQIPAHVARSGQRLGLAFDFTSDVQRDALIVALFNSPGIVRMEQRPTATSVARELLWRVVDADMTAAPIPAAAVAAPAEQKLPPRTRVVPGRRAPAARAAS